MKIAPPLVVLTKGGYFSFILHPFARGQSRKSGAVADGVGCIQRPHVEDKVTSALLKTFETATQQDITYIPPVMQEPTEAQPAPLTPIEDDTFTTFNGQFYLKYRVTPSETLVGVALRFGLSVSELKTLNKIRNDMEFYGRGFVLVPWVEGKEAPDQGLALKREEEEKRQHQASRFGQEHSISFAEAKWYLSDSDWDNQKAALKLKEDLHWEKEHRVQHSQDPSPLKIN